MIEEPDVIDRLGNLIELLHFKEREMLARGPGPLAVLKDVKIWRNWEDYPVLEPPDKTRWQKKLDRLGKQWDLYQVAFLRRFFRRWVDQTLAGDAAKNSGVIRKIVQTVMKRKEEKQRKEAKAKRVKFVGLPGKREGTPEKKSDAKKEKNDRRKFVRKAAKAIEAEKKKKQKKKQEKGTEKERIEDGEEKVKNMEDNEQKEGEESKGQEKSEENKDQGKSEENKDQEQSEEKKASNVTKKHAKKKGKQKSSKKKQQEERSRALAKEREAIIRRVSQRRHQEKIMPSLNLKYELEDDVQVSLGEITAQYSQDQPSTHTEVGQSELDGPVDEQSGSERAAEECEEVTNDGVQGDEALTHNSCIEEESENETQSKPSKGEIQEAVTEEESGPEQAVEEESEIEHEVDANSEPGKQFEADNTANGEPEHSERLEAPDINQEEHEEHTDEEEDHVEHAHMGDDSPEPENEDSHTTDTTNNDSQPSTSQENMQSTSPYNIGAAVPTQEEEENTEVMSLIFPEEESDMNI